MKKIVLFTLFSGSFLLNYSNAQDLAPHYHQDNPKSFKYFKEIQGNLEYPTSLKGKFEITPADTLRYKNFYRLTFQLNKVVGVYQNRFSYGYTMPDITYCFETRYELDHNGNYSKAMFFNRLGNRIDQYGCYYSAFKCDSRGNIIEAADYKRNGTLLVDYSGQGYTIRKFNEKNQVIESAIYDENHELIESMPIERFSYDANGFIAEITYVDKNGMPFQNYDAEYGYSYTGRITYKRDSKGNILEESHYDIDGKFMEGYGMTKSKYDEKNNLIETAYCDEQGNIIDNEYASVTQFMYDANGNMIEEHKLNALKEFLSEGVTKIKYTYDANQDLVEMGYYAIDNTLIDDYTGIARLQKKYDSRHNVIEEKTFDANNNLIGNYDGIAIYRYKYDQYDNRIETAIFNQEEQPMKTDYVSAIQRNKFDSRGNLLEEAYYDEAGDLIEEYYSSAAITKYLYDKNGYQIEKATYGADGELKPD